MDTSSFQETFNTDPDLTFDDLPMPFRMLNTLLWSVIDEAWNHIETKQKYEGEKLNFQQSYLQNLDVNMDIENIHMFTIVGQYLFKIFESQISVYDDLNNLRLISEWHSMNETTNSCNSRIRTLKTIQYDQNVILLLIIDDSGQIKMMMFVEGLFIPIKPANLSSSDNLLYHILNGKISICGKFYISLNEDSINSKIWLEIYRLPVDQWLKEILPITQEIQNAKLSTLRAETQDLIPNLIERKSFFENQFQLSSPVLLGRIKYPIMSPNSACKSITAALKQANDKANLFSYSNLSTCLYSDVINETNQLAFIKNRNYPSCLTARLNKKNDENNSLSIQGSTESPESAKQKIETLEISQSNSPSSIKQPTTINKKSSSKHNPSVVKKQHRERTTNENTEKKKDEKMNGLVETVDSLSNKDLAVDVIDQEDKKLLKTILLQQQQHEEINRQQLLLKELTETQPKCYPYFEFLPISLSPNSKQSEPPSLTSMSSSTSASICVYWSGSCYLFFYALDNFSKKDEECLIEEIRYFGSKIMYISVTHSNHFINDDKHNLSKKLEYMNSQDNNYYLVIGLQSGLVIINQLLQSGRYLPIIHIESGSLVDASLLTSTKNTTSILLTACYLTVNRRHSSENDFLLRREFAFDIYSLDKNQLTWKKLLMVGKKKFRCQAITILSVDNDNFSIVVCLVLSNNLLIYPLNHCLQHEQSINTHQAEMHHSNQMADCDLEQFCQHSLQISLPNPYVISLNTGTVSLFPEVNEQCIDNGEFHNQLRLIKRSTNSTIHEFDNETQLKQDEMWKEQKLSGRQDIYELWIRGTNIDQLDEGKIQSKLFRVYLKHKPIEIHNDYSLALNNTEANMNVSCSSDTLIQSYSNKLLLKRNFNETIRRLSFQNVWKQLATL
ncbi:unnamed protein product [Schistosoma turkestanicum]|nr:unnamed protein product [Schistosoma turkestanicum]